MHNFNIHYASGFKPWDLLLINAIGSKPWSYYY